MEIPNSEFIFNNSDINSFTVSSLVNISNILGNLSTIITKLKDDIVEIKHSMKSHEKDGDNQRRQIETKIVNLITQIDSLEKDLTKRYMVSDNKVNNFIKNVEAEITSVKGNVNSLERKLNEIVNHISENRNVLTNKINEQTEKLTADSQKVSHDTSYFMAQQPLPPPPQNQFHSSSTGVYLNPNATNMQIHQSLQQLVSPLEIPQQQQKNKKTAWEKFIELLENRTFQLIIIGLLMCFLVFKGVSMIRYGDFIVETHSNSKHDSSGIELNKQNRNGLQLPTPPKLPELSK